MRIWYDKMNPNGFWLLKYLQDASKRFVLLFGGSSSGKSYSVAQVLLQLTLFEGESQLVLRKVGASIEKTIFSDFKACLDSMPEIKEHFRVMTNKIMCNTNGAKIDFSGIDDPEKIKGISQYKRVFLDELSEYTESDFKQIRKRLRGKKGQQIIGAWNPISEEHWIKKKLIDVEVWHDVPMELSFGDMPLPSALCKVKSVKINSSKTIANARTGEYEEQPPNMMLIQSTYLNNFWVVGSPNGKYGFYDSQCIADFEHDRVNDPDYYQVYALGEWGHIRTGAEFFPSFNRGTVCGKFPYNPTLPIHLCMDSNVLPYVTATFFQKEYKPDDTQQVTQIGELPIESPNNSARKAAKVIANKLREWRYRDKVYIHGDASGKAANTIDPENRSFFDLVIDELELEGFTVEDCIGNKNPSVATTGEFINAIWDGRIPGVSLRVDDNCKVSIDDYTQVQKDENGAILKTKVTDRVTKRKYEAHGHISDCLRYAINDLLRAQYTDFSLGRKRSLYGESEINYFNPSAVFSYEYTMVYIIPNIGGQCSVARCGRIGNKWHLLDAATSATAGNEEIEDMVVALKADEYFVECQQAYFPMVRSLREKLPQVNVLKMASDAKTRIAAMSDWVKANILVNPDEVEDGEYGNFIASVLDYNDNTPIESIGPSLVLSGMARIITHNRL